jgi:hypothetical protein
VVLVLLDTNDVIEIDHHRESAGGLDVNELSHVMLPLYELASCSVVYLRRTINRKVGATAGARSEHWYSVGFRWQGVMSFIFILYCVVGCEASQPAHRINSAYETLERCDQSLNQLSK